MPTLMLLLLTLLLDGPSNAAPTYPPLESLGGDDTTDILRIKRHRTMPHRGG